MFGWTPRGPEGAWEHVVFLQESGGWLRKRETAKKGQTLTSFLGTTVNETGKAFNKNTRPQGKKIIIFSPPCRGKLATASAFDLNRA
jgi:hypothetical protein